MPKISLIGNGKTGGAVERLLPPDEIAAVFNSKNPPTVETLKNSDVAIVFVPGHVLNELVPVLIQSAVPVVCGSTGFEWTMDVRRAVENSGATWITASNFSMGMQWMFRMAREFRRLESQWAGSEAEIFEVHHIHKKDKPSGSALSIRQHYGKQIPIHSDRTGDVVGFHSLVLATASEKLMLSHHVEDRSVFARGAIWAAQKLIEKRSRPQDYPSGIFPLEDVFETWLNEGQ